MYNKSMRGYEFWWQEKALWNFHGLYKSEALYIYLEFQGNSIDKASTYMLIFSLSFD